MKRCTLLIVLLLAATWSRAEMRTVGDDAAVAAALRRAKAGDVIRLEPGTYRGGLWMETSGTADAPIIIEAADPTQPPEIVGGGNAIQLRGCSYVTLRNLRMRGQTGNGLNCDDGGRMDLTNRGIVLEDLHISDVGPKGNTDGIKLSGLSGFVIRRCTINGWGGSGIDMVGCHDGVIEDCTLIGKEGFEQSNGIQAKGGSAGIIIRRCDFRDTGHRGINCGGSTGLQFFRPRDATAEAKDIRIEHCRFVGGNTAVAFVGVDGATFERNTIYQPRQWIFRILQETTGARFVPSRNVRFAHNLVIFRADQIRTHVNIGPNTAPDTFTFTANHWYCQDRPAASRPRLPAEERDGVHGQDPQLRLDDHGFPLTALADHGAARGEP